MDELEEQQVAFGMRRTTLTDDTTLVELSGQIDLHTAPQLKEHLLSAIDDGAVDVGQPEVPARVSIRELLVIEAEKMKHGRVQIVYMHAVLGRCEPELVCGTVN